MECSYSCLDRWLGLERIPTRHLQFSLIAKVCTLPPADRSVRRSDARSARLGRQLSVRSSGAAFEATAATSNQGIATRN